MRSRFLCIVAWSFCCFGSMALLSAIDEIPSSADCTDEIEQSKKHAGFKRARDYSYCRRVRRRASGQNASSAAVKISVGSKMAVLSSEAARESGLIYNCMFFAKDNEAVCAMEFSPLLVNPELLGDIAGFLHAFAAERSYAERVGEAPNFVAVYRSNAVVFFEDELESLLRAAHYLQIEPLIMLLSHDKDVSSTVLEELALRRKVFNDRQDLDLYKDIH